MKKVELLSPAGSFESLKMAVENGCDAVYFAGKRFGARAFSNNFNMEEIKEAIDYCHLYGVKAYITINTIIYEDEVEEFLEYVEFIHKNGVDAVIIQDLGMIDLLRQKYPNLELHASTQMNIHTIEELKKMKELGFKRVVLARECSIELIRKMKEEVDIELEVFVHGALCVSYSGQCLMSYMIGKRSANRGECAQACRQKYKLYENDKQIKLDDEYLLSTKDLCLIDNLKELEEIGIDSLKIEGRMKSKEYVASVTKAYRNAIDFSANKQDKLDMIKMFNRGYTLGNLYNQKGKNFINGFRPNHMGYLIGEVIDYKNRQVFVKLNSELSQGDGIRFITEEEIGFNANKIYKNKLLVNGAKENEIVAFDMNKNIKLGTKVYKTLDYKLIQEINNNINKRKITLDGNFLIKNNKIIFTVTDGINTETIKLNDIVTKAKNKPTTIDEIRQKLNKLGNTPYVFNKIDISIPDNIFIPMTIINNLKRDIIEKITEDRLNKKDITTDSYKYNSTSYDDEFNYIFDVKNEEQLKYILDNTNHLIYVGDYKLYKKYENNDRVIFKNSRINPLPVSIKKEFVAGEISSIKNNCISDVYFNVVNSYGISFLHNLGCKRVTLSYELDFDKTKSIIDEYKKNYKTNPCLEVIVYGKPEIMVSKYCILNTYLGNGQKTNCNICKNNRYYLEDKYKNKYEIIKNNDCNMRIIDYKNINMIDEIQKYKEIGINNFRFILNDESINELKKLAIV